MSDTDFDLDALPDHLEPDERDVATFDMFGGADTAAPVALSPAEPAPAYTVLARKYRPRTFEDLIGQEAMVRTLTNAFATGRIAHAFMLTGVRGVGKTTTARLLARALNYRSESMDAPSVALGELGRSCLPIIEGRHMDVLEIDAASHTGIDNMRELLDSIRYAPVEGRFKIYIMDEVHMLSKGAFNALLKTLEEPPPHAKFIFATTEIRKVPVTILSRCQRFDLRRVEPEVLVAHLRRICLAEGVEVDDDALALIARAAEGSVRDALSLLDQAIVQAERGAPVGAMLVRDMLGLADRAATIELFEAVMRGAMGEALAGFRTLYGYGADPGTVVLDVLEHCHGASIAKALGPQALSLPKDQASRLAAIGSAASAGTLSRLWQMLLKAHDEVRRAPDPAAAAEMALIRLCYAAELPGPEEAVRRLQDGAGLAPAPTARPSASPGASAPSAQAPGGGGLARAVAPQQQPTPTLAAAEPRPQLASFEDVLKLIAEKRDVGLKLDVERYVKPVDVRPGVIRFEPAAGAPASLSQRLASRLKEWTGQPWMLVHESAGGAETVYERDKRTRAEARAGIEADPFVQAVMQVFPGTQIVSVRELKPLVGARPEPDASERDDA